MRDQRDLIQRAGIRAGQEDLPNLGGTNMENLRKTFYGQGTGEEVENQCSREEAVSLIIQLLL